MTLNLTSVNIKGVRNPSKCAHLVGELSNLCVDVVTVQETHFICAADSRVLENDFVFFSAYGSRCSVGVSLLVGCTLDAKVNLVFVGDGGQLIVADVAVKSFKFRVVAVYVPNTVVERRCFFRQLGPFLDDRKWVLLMGD